MLSLELLQSQGLPTIKPSTVKVQTKQVIVWTPVVIEKTFPQQVKSLKLEYRTNEFLNKQDFPQLSEDLVGGLIIKMPLTKVKDYLQTQLLVDQLLTDDQLVLRLEESLEQSRVRSGKSVLNKGTDVTLVMESELFSVLDEPTKQLVFTEVHRAANRVTGVVDDQGHCEQHTRKRERKFLEKQKLAVELYFKQRKKPRDISKQLRKPVE